LLRIRIAHVTAIGLNPIIADGNVSFDPVPMRHRDPENYEAGAEIAIPPATCEQFAKEFRGQAKVNSTYGVDSGQYVYIDPSVRTALKVVKAKQRASLEERMAFLMSPSRAITEAYRQEGAEESEIPIGDSIFFETSQYSDRVTGIGEWIPPQLSYLESDPNNWLPERFSVVLSGKLVTGKPDDVVGWIEAVKRALASKNADVSLGDVTIPTDTPGLLATLQRLQPPEVKPASRIPESETTTEVPTRRRIQVLKTIHNFDDHAFKKKFRERKLEHLDAAYESRTKGASTNRRSMADGLLSRGLARSITC